MTQYTDWSVRKILNILDNNLEEILGLVGLLTYTGIILYNILLRVAINEQTPWRQAAVLGLFVWVAWITTALIVRDRNHLRFSLLYDRYDNRTTYLVTWVEWILWLVFSLGILQESIRLVQNYVESGAVIVGTSIPRYLIFLSIPVGFVLITFRVLQQMVVVTKQYRRGEDIASETEIEA